MRKHNKHINTLFEKKIQNLLMLQQVVRISTVTFKGLIMSNDLKGRNRGLFEIISCNSSGKTTTKGVSKEVITCIDSIYSLYYTYIFQSTQLYNNSTGYSDMFRLKKSSSG